MIKHDTARGTKVYVIGETLITWKDLALQPGPGEGPLVYHSALLTVGKEGAYHWSSPDNPICVIEFDGRLHMMETAKLTLDLLDCARIALTT